MFKLECKGPLKKLRTYLKLIERGVFYMTTASRVYV